MTGCNPLDPSCFCPIPDIAQGLDTCLAWFCPVLGYYGSFGSQSPSIKTVMLTIVTEGLYLYHSTCNSPIRNQATPLFNEVITVASIAFAALILRFTTRLPPLSVEWGIDDWLAVALVVRILYLYASNCNTDANTASSCSLSCSYTLGN